MFVFCSINQSCLFVDLVLFILYITISIFQMKINLLLNYSTYFYKPVQARLTKMHLNTLAEMPLATSYSPFSFLVVYSIVEPNILEYKQDSATK